MSVEEFMQSYYASKYILDVRNMHWRCKMNTIHVFDIFREFSELRDSVKMSLDMIELLIKQRARYEWTWVTKMT